MITHGSRVQEERVFPIRSLVRLGSDVGDRITHSDDLLVVFVGNRDAELVFGRHQQLDEIDRIALEVVDELACPG